MTTYWWLQCNKCLWICCGPDYMVGVLCPNCYDDWLYAHPTPAFSAAKDYPADALFSLPLWLRDSLNNPPKPTQEPSEK